MSHPPPPNISELMNMEPPWIPMVFLALLGLMLLAGLIGCCVGWLIVHDTNDPPPNIDTTHGYQPQEPRQ